MAYILPRRRLIDVIQSGTTPLSHVLGGNVFLASVIVGGQDFKVVIDTGSSDPWLAHAEFTCFDPDDDSQIPEEDCAFGRLYDLDQSSTYSPVPDQNFNITYADGEYLTGFVGLETFTMAGIQVPQQKFGVVDQAAWYGDEQSSGLVGFAYSTLTSIYAGEDPTADKKGQSVPYNPLFVNMYTNEGVPPVFTMAIDRDERVGGILALGGIPDIPHAPSFATTPIEPVRVSTATRDAVYDFYTITVDGYAYSNSTGPQFNPFDNENPLKRPLVADGSEAIIDSGTSLCYVPNEVADGLAEAFDPPAEYDETYDIYSVDCNATAPVFGIAIEQKVFYMNIQDLVLEIEEGQCILGVQPALDGLSVLGATWLKNVMAVFDIGAEQMRFAAREFYSVASSPSSN